MITKELTNANIYLKDGKKKFVAIIDDAINASAEKIRYISNNNITNFLETGNSRFIETIDTFSIAGIDMDLK